MSTLHLYFLGPPRIERDNVPVHVDTRKAVGLLIYLALSGEQHPREELATFFWPERPKTKARATLRRTLSALKKVIGAKWIEANRLTIGLCVRPSFKSIVGVKAVDTTADTLWLDVFQFRQLLIAADIQAQPSPDLTSRHLNVLAEAAALYRSDFLTGFTLSDSVGFDDWQAHLCQQLRQEMGQILEQLTNGYAARHELQTAIHYARRWLALDPLHEAIHQQLMTLYAQAGDQVAAREQYDQCRRILKAELQLPPSPATEQIYHDIIAGRRRKPRLQPEEKGEAELHEAIGDLQTMLGKYGIALRHYETAVTYHSAKTLAALQHKLGVIYNYQGKWNLAEHQFLQAIDTLGDEETTSLHVHIYADWSLTSYHQGYINQAFDYAQRALDMAQKIKDKQALAQAYNALGLLNHCQENDKEARFYLEHALALAKTENNKNIQAAVFNNLALVNAACGDLEQALALAEKGLTVCAAHGNRHHEAALNNNLADLFHMAGQPEEAKFHVKQAVAIYSEIGIEAGAVHTHIWDLRVW